MLQHMSHYIDKYKYFYNGTKKANDEVCSISVFPVIFFLGKLFQQTAVSVPSHIYLFIYFILFGAGAYC